MALISQQKCTEYNTTILKDKIIAGLGQIQSEALINLFDEKGLVSKQELLTEMKRVQAKIID
jgi:hypothetical protein